MSWLRNRALCSQGKRGGRGNQLAAGGERQVRPTDRPTERASEKPAGVARARSLARSLPRSPSQSEKIHSGRVQQAIERRSCRRRRRRRRREGGEETYFTTACVLYCAAFHTCRNSKYYGRHFICLYVACSVSWQESDLDGYLRYPITPLPLAFLLLLSIPTIISSSPTRESSDDAEAVDGRQRRMQIVGPIVYQAPDAISERVRTHVHTLGGIANV